MRSLRYILLALLILAGPAFAGSEQIIRSLDADEFWADDFCPEFRSSFTVYQTENFEIVHQGCELSAERIGQLLESAQEIFYSAFTQKEIQPEPLQRPLLWISFTCSQDFSTYARTADGMNVSWLDGYYSAGTNRVAVLLGADTAMTPIYEIAEQIMLAHDPDQQIMPDDILARASVGDYNAATQIMHEAAHQLAFNSGLQRRGVMYPLWVSEGLAMAFETGFTADGNVRASRLKEMAQQDALVPFEQFVTLNTVQFHQISPRDIYAQGWGMFRFMIRRYPGRFKAYLRNLANLEPGWRSDQTMRQEFVDIFGPVDQISRDWDKFLAELVQ